MDCKKNRVWFLAGFTLARSTTAGPHFPEEAAADLFKRFNEKYNRSSAENATHRFLAFKRNVQEAMEFNALHNASCKDLLDDSDCMFGVTEFSDMSKDEFETTHLGYKPSKPHDHLVLEADVFNSTSRSLPMSVDWRKHGAVTKVKNQGYCGNCWAYSAVETIESALFLSTKTLEELSVQQLTSCDKQDLGCDGGDTITAYQFVKRHGGLDSRADYPDTSPDSGKTEHCLRKKVHGNGRVSGYSYAVKPCNRGNCKHQDENRLAAVLAEKGPLSICLNAGGHGWMNYRSGVYSHSCSPAAAKMDHCVQLVGYDRSGPKPYWIVRNTWGPAWGIGGYIHLEMGKNLCGIANEATSVQIETEDSIVVV